MELKLLVHHRRITSCKLILSGWMIVYSKCDLGPNFLLLNWPLMRKENSSERQHPIKRKKGVFLSKQPKSFPQQRLSKKHFCWSGCKSGISIVDSVTVPSKSFYIKNNPLPKNKRGTNQHMSGKNWKKLLKECRCFFLFYLERNGGGVGSAINHFLAVVKNY